MNQFLRRDDGGVAVIYAISLIPLSLLTLTAIDFHRASSVRQALQDSLDAAALAVARSNATAPADVKALGEKVLQANLQPLTGATLQSFQFTPKSDGTIVATATVSVKPVITNLFTGEPMKVAASSETVRANYKLEIALVLDNTGSMSSNNKLTTLKDAATSLVDTLAAGAARSVEPDAVRISLVPFSQTVRLAPSYQTAVWMNQTASQTGNDYALAGADRFNLFKAMNITWAGCMESRPYPYDVRDDGAALTKPESLFVPYFAPDEPGNAGDTSWSNGSTNYEVTNSYLPDGIAQKVNGKTNPDYTNWSKRQGNIAKYGASGLSVTSSRGPNQGCGLEPTTRLTTDYAAIKASIKRMTAVGNTNVPFGMIWGWHTLSPNNPFGDGKPYGTQKLKKILIVMTDGENTNDDANNPNNSSYSGIGYLKQNRIGITDGTTAQRRTALDNRMAELCTNMKAKDITVYTVAVQVDQTAVNLLKACATSADHAYDVKNVSDMKTAFDAIAGSISNLRIAK
ncbi:TadE/TadG family type IV pilus assembly protein [Caulobacter sp. 17J80-11]|uniref:TadE/TadG family type IV pilus assembly protein n=1 Tax=Caulobacter sp. 17J80-11 TaxID=2763502 RepID=UPI0016539DD6|nr:TadE/TadG family type IV pilus assembly protein [Caulobacter sp. 17J80-11]MBC6983632.1 pilus assembly protein [Caulobacter sp. 17J80-11]